MDTKRTVTVDLLGHRLTVRTTEPEEALQRNIARVRDVLEQIQDGTDAVDSLRLFALGLLHLGRELDMLENRYSELSELFGDKLESWTATVHRTLGE